ncbi:MAG: cupredoxin domain-containing protein [Chlamydiota bacterium]
MRRILPLLITVCFSFSMMGCFRNDSPVTSKPIPVISSSLEVDWSQMETITLAMNEYYFSPAELFLSQGKPYQLHLKNEGSKAHNFISPGLFGDIMIQKIESSDGEITARSVDGIEVYPGHAIDLFFIPRFKDTYQFSSATSNHVGRRMAGKIIVQ